MSRRTLFLKQGYVSALSGLIGACNIFLEKIKQGLNPKLEKYGRYLIQRLNNFPDESWRFEGEYEDIVKEAYNTLREFQKVIGEILNTRKIDTDELETLQKKADRIFLQLNSIEKEILTAVSAGWCLWLKN